MTHLALQKEERRWRWPKGERAEGDGEGEGEGEGNVVSHSLLRTGRVERRTYLPMLQWKRGREAQGQLLVLALDGAGGSRTYLLRSRKLSR